MIIRMAVPREIIPKASLLNKRWQDNTKCQIINQWGIQDKDQWTWISQSLRNIIIHHLVLIILLWMFNQASGIHKCHQIWVCLHNIVEYLLKTIWNLPTTTNWSQLTLWCLSSLLFKHHKTNTTHKTTSINRCRLDTSKFSIDKNHNKGSTLGLLRKLWSQTQPNKSLNCNLQSSKIWCLQLN